MRRREDSNLWRAKPSLVFKTSAFSRTLPRLQLESDFKSGEGGIRTLGRVLSPTPT